MMYQACSSPGMYPSMHRAMLMKESAEQTPDFIQTVMNGFRMGRVGW